MVTKRKFGFTFRLDGGYCCVRDVSETTCGGDCVCVCVCVCMLKNDLQKR